MSSNNPQGEQMDAAAAEAMKEFKPDWSAQELVAWINKWYMRAGYKRLTQALLKAFGFRN